MTQYWIRVFSDIDGREIHKEWFATALEREVYIEMHSDMVDFQLFEVVI